MLAVLCISGGGSEEESDTRLRLPVDQARCGGSLQDSARASRCPPPAGVVLGRISVLGHDTTFWAPLSAQDI